MNDFNAAAQKQAYSEATQKILQTINKTRLSLSLRDAVVAGDFAGAADLRAKGADAMHRNHAAVDALVKYDTVEAQRLLETLGVPSYYRTLGDGVFVQAVKTGNMATVQDALSRDPSTDTLSRALVAALQENQDGIADLLVQHLKKEDMTDGALVALLIHRPALYEEAVAGRTERADLPDFIGHFYAAVKNGDHAAMEKSLGKMIEHKDKLATYRMTGGDLDDGIYSDLPYHLLQTGDIPVIDRFLENFPSVTSTRALLNMAIDMNDEQPALLQHLAEKHAPTPEQIRIAIRNMSGDATAAALYFAANWTEIVKADPARVLATLARDKNAAPLIKAVEENGIALPMTEKDRGDILASAVRAGAAETEAWLLKQIALTPAVLERLQGAYEYPVKKRAIELGAGMRFDKDALFWDALRSNDLETVRAFPRDPKISTETEWKVGSGLVEAVKTGDMALLKDIIDAADWTEGGKKQLFRASVKSLPALELVAANGLLPETFNDGNLHDIALGGGAAVLDFLVDRQKMPFGDKLAQEALRVAVHKNSAGMVEDLMARGVDPAPIMQEFLAAIENSATLETMAVVEKWRVRAEVIAAPALADEAKTAGNLFEGASSVAIRAAYADGFAAVMKQAASAPGFDPAVLLSTKDAHGNSVLEILGAHGRLADILKPAALWKDRDAVAFIEQNTPKSYHAQVDYHGLKAALDQLKLQEASKGKRFKLG